jgi:hypothetical protein
VREIRGAVERVHVPAKFRGAIVTSALFRSDGVVGEIFGNPFDDGALRALVGLGDEVGFPFVGNVRRTMELFAKDLSGFLSNFDRSFEIVFGHERWQAPIGRQHARALSPLYHPRGRNDAQENLRASPVRS